MTVRRIGEAYESKRMNNALNNDDKEARRSLMMVRACLCLSIIASGLALRGFGLGLGIPVFFVKYRGPLPWAAMGFFRFAPASSSPKPPPIPLFAASIASALHPFPLSHPPSPAPLPPPPPHAP